VQQSVASPIAMAPTARHLSSMTTPDNVGIVAMDIYFPQYYVDHTDLEQHDGVSAGKYTKGLGQKSMAFCSDREDIYSMCMSAVSNLMAKNNIDYKDIGRLEVGSETILDHSKAIKTYLMQLFEASGNTDVEGVDTINACYGGTSALLNSLAWVESSSWDGRYALVVAADIAEYEPGPARPTGGAGAVAFLIGKNAPLAFDSVRGSHFAHVYDFFKPNLNSPYPVVDGKFSQECYFRALDSSYERYVSKAKKATGADFDMTVPDYMGFHAPYIKLVQKSFGRLYYNDFRANPDNPAFASCAEFKDVSLQDSYNDNALAKAFTQLSNDDYEKKVVPTTLLPSTLGNMYTASLYAGILSLISEEHKNLPGKKVQLFSYGSGSAATMFSATAGTGSGVESALADMASRANLNERLASRVRKDPKEFNEAMGVREMLHDINRDFKPSGSVDDLAPGAFYLQEIDGNHHRHYAQKPL
jgi:hydroxymethylglutaryl-CoA synthase